MSSMAIQAGRSGVASVLGNDGIKDLWVSLPPHSVVVSSREWYVAFALVRISHHHPRQDLTCTHNQIVHHPRSFGCTFPLLSRDWAGMIRECQFASTPPGLSFRLPAAVQPKENWSRAMFWLACAPHTEQGRVVDWSVSRTKKKVDIFVVSYCKTPGWVDNDKMCRTRVHNCRLLNFIQSATDNKDWISVSRICQMKSLRR